MAYAKQAPRLSRQELRDLGKAAAQLMTVHEALQRTNWAGAAPSAAIVGEAINVIVAVYRRCRIWLPEVRAELEAEALARQQSETGAADGQELSPPAPGVAEEE